MLRTIEAVIEADGQVRLLEPNSVSGARRALVTVTTSRPSSRRS